MQGLQDTRVIIVGAGMSGLLAAIRLKQRGIDDLVILEKGGGVGGTWRDNAYPGCACDVPSHLYSYSFAPNPRWSRMFAGQPEILAYFERQADAHRLDHDVRLDTEVTDARFDPADHRWTVTAADGRAWRAPALIVATGQLNRVNIPDIPGREDFAGAQFHTARWDASVDLAGKRVGVIGTGASAIQVVPGIVDRVGHLTVFQRSPPWIVPREDHAFSPRAQTSFAWLPLLRRAFRWLIWRKLEATWPAIGTPEGAKAGEIEALARDHLKAQVPDAALRAKLAPDFPIGCKRTLLSDDYYPALMRRRVDLETRAIAAIAPDGVRLADGETVPLDVLIWATGFASHGFVAPIAITGPRGTLASAWRRGAVAYRGTTVSGFPNLFLLYGPNTNLGHNSIIFMVEQQMRYALPAILKLARGEARRIEVRTDTQDAYNRTLQNRLLTTAWAGGCESWYKTGSGIMPNNWGSDTRAFAKMMRRFDAEAYEIG
ncbi:cation diffusion facilitator CzcD-associated flavoprotein CzcO [Hephaestia caeni]|uniref:Cation diffusion facilitator CzcD-associated flavoprotein CzcO n=1 Tax=Hephaestia caeni TaxID=645617 RepID=A0A397NDD6_9SPHN|nr:NAD(P)/FAD-dependent oxidoreductase [Hephaestia caeni]RIA35456.1 cation diffusion facilitator CzcD-associated flavoprotein CzcO [Hephaestia caeni]